VQNAQVLIKLIKVMKSSEITNFRNDFEKAVEGLQKKYGVNIKLGTIRYNSTEVRFKVTATDGIPTQKLSKEDFNIGDIVTINHKSVVGKKFLIEKIMSKNIRVSEIGGFMQSRVSPSLLQKAS